MRLISLLLLLLSSFCVCLAVSGDKCIQSFRIDGSANKTLVDADIANKKCGIVQFFIVENGQCRAIDIFVANNFHKTVATGRYGCHLTETDYFGMEFCTCQGNECNSFESRVDIKLEEYLKGSNMSSLKPMDKTSVSHCASKLGNDSIPKVNGTSGDSEYIRVFYDCVKSNITLMEVNYPMNDILKDCEKKALSYTSIPTTIETTRRTTTKRQITTTTVQTTLKPLAVATTLNSMIVDVSTKNTDPEHEEEQADPSNKAETDENKETQSGGSHSESAGLVPYFIVIGVILAVIAVAAALFIYLNKAKKKQAARAKSEKNPKNAESPVVVNPVVEMVEAQMSVSAKPSQGSSSTTPSKLSSKSPAVLDQTQLPSVKSTVQK